MSGNLNMSKLIGSTIFALAICMSAAAFSQVATQPAQPPWFFYWPSEDPDNFQYSGLGSSSLSGANRFERRSNVEVNRRVEEEEENTANTSAIEPPTSIEVDTETAGNIDSRPASGSSIFKWVDDDGVVHVTNNLGSIPEKYRNQVE